MACPGWSRTAGFRGWKKRRIEPAVARGRIWSAVPRRAAFENAHDREQGKADRTEPDDYPRRNEEGVVGDCSLKQERGEKQTGERRSNRDQRDPVREREAAPPYQRQQQHLAQDTVAD